ncbi:OprD family outer membrane porin [Endozoicomonadaceae bacterium StTr2]
MKKLALAVMVATTAAASAQAAETVTMDPSLDLTYRNYFWKQKDNARKDDNLNAYYRDEWVQALIADFDTGYVNDMVGAVVTAGATHTLHAENDTPNNGKKVHTTNIAEGRDGKTNDIAGLQQAYLKAKYNIGEVALKGSFGVKKRGYELYGNSGSRILAGSSNGLDLSAEWKDLKVYASRITGASNRNQSALSRDLYVNIKKDANGNITSRDKLDNVTLYGVNYSIAGVDLTAEHLVSKDYLKKTFLKAAHSFELAEGMTLDTDIRYGHATDAGKLYDNQDYKSSYFNANAKINYMNAYLGFGFNKVKDGDWDDNVGDKGNAGSYNTTLSQWYDYDKEGEKAWIVEAGYNFADLGMPGLSWDVYYAQGKDAKNYKSDFKRQETFSFVTYKFDGQLKGLKVKWLHVQANANGTKIGETKNSMKNRDRSNRFYIEYSMSIF